MLDERDLARRAFELFMRATHSELPLPEKWESLSDNERGAWAQVAMYLHTLGQGDEEKRQKELASRAANLLRGRAITVLYEAACDGPDTHLSSPQALEAARALLNQTDAALAAIMLNGKAVAQLAEWCNASFGEEKAAP